MRNGGKSEGAQGVHTTFAEDKNQENKVRDSFRERECVIER